MPDFLMVPISVWCSRYIAGFCLVSIVVWGVGMYIWSKDWQSKIRDAGIYLGAIGVLVVVLALRPEKDAPLYWKAITWFSFSMLVVLEVLWLAFLIKLICAAIGRAAHQDAEIKKPPTTRQHYR